MTPRQKRAAIKWLKRYRKCARQTVGAERAKYQMAVRNWSAWLKLETKKEDSCAN